MWYSPKGTFTEMSINFCHGMGWKITVLKPLTYLPKANEFIPAYVSAGKIASFKS